MEIVVIEVRVCVYQKNVAVIVQFCVNALSNYFVVRRYGRNNRGRGVSTAKAKSLFRRDFNDN